MVKRRFVSELLWDDGKTSSNILADYHIHSTFSPEASNSLDQMCQHALQIGFKEIAFTEHLEWHPDWIGSLDIDAYLNSVRTVKNRYTKEGLKVYTGIEVGNPHDYPDQASAIFTNQEFDVIISALHWLRNKNIQLTDCFIDRDLTDVYVEYFLEIANMSACCDFDILAHFDRIFLTGWMLGIMPELVHLESVIRTAFSTMAEHKQILELNTKLFSLMPPVWKDIMITVISWFWKEGGQSISIGSDAHNIYDIGRHFDIAEEIMNSTQFEIILPGTFGKIVNNR